MQAVLVLVILPLLALHLVYNSKSQKLQRALRAQRALGMKCPLCGGAVKPISDARAWIALLSFGIFSFGSIRNNFRCTNCGHRFH